MGTKTFLSELAQYKIVMLDTVSFIYYIEKDPVYIELARELFAKIESGSLTDLSSIITLIEVLIVPILKNRKDLIKAYRDMLLNTSGINTYEIDAEIGEKAAALRAKYNLKIPNAIQLAVGITKNADAFFTNDEAMRKVSEIEVIVFKDFINKP